MWQTLRAAAGYIGIRVARRLLAERQEVVCFISVIRSYDVLLKKGRLASLQLRRGSELVLTALPLPGAVSRALLAMNWGTVLGRELG